MLSSLLSFALISLNIFMMSDCPSFCILICLELGLTGVLDTELFSYFAVRLEFVPISDT